MTDEFSLTLGAIAALVMAVIQIVRMLSRESLQEAADRAFEQHKALVKSMKPPMPPPPPVPGAVDDVLVHEMISRGRDNYGQVIESVTTNLSRQPRLKPTCGWCRTDLKLDNHGVCAGCGARP